MPFYLRVQGACKFVWKPGTHIGSWHLQHHGYCKYVRRESCPWFYHDEAACMCLSLVANDTGLGIYKRKKES